MQNNRKAATTVAGIFFFTAFSCAPEVAHEWSVLPTTQAGALCPPQEEVDICTWSEGRTVFLGEIVRRSLVLTPSVDQNGGEVVWCDKGLFEPALLMSIRVLEGFDDSPIPGSIVSVTVGAKQLLGFDPGPDSPRIEEQDWSFEGTLEVGTLVGINSIPIDGRFSLANERLFTIGSQGLQFQGRANDCRANPAPWNWQGTSRDLLRKEMRTCSQTQSEASANPLRPEETHAAFCLTGSSEEFECAASIDCPTGQFCVSLICE